MDSSSTRTAPAEQSDILRWPVGREAALIALVAFAVVLWPREVLNDGDTWWHLSVGDWIIANRAVPHTDPFSYTFAGQSWVAHEWLSELLMSLSFTAGGWPGVMVLTAAAFALGTWLLGRFAERFLRGLPLWLTLLGGLVLFAPHLLARPHILVLPVMVIWLAGLAEARREKRLPSFWLLAAMVIWANMHGSFIVGVALIAPFALEAMIETRRWRTAFVWMAFGAGALVATLCTPFGIEGLLLPFRLLTMRNLQGIGEWAPLPFNSVQPLHVVVLGFAIFAVLKRPKIGWVRWVVLLGLLAMSVRTQRHEMLLGLMGILLLAEPLAQALGQPVRSALPAAREWALLVPALILAGIRLALPIAEPVNARDPALAIAAVPDALRTQHVLNDYSFGGHLIRAGIAPFIDSRAELYGDGFLDQYSALQTGGSDVLADALSRYDVAWTMLSPGNAMAASMATMPGWRRIYADAVAVIDVRETTFTP